MKITKHLIMLVMAASLFSNCSSDQEIVTEPDPNQESNGSGNSNTEVPAPISLDSIRPLSGPKGTLVTLYGDNFGTTASDVMVHINQKEMSIASVENDEIQIEVLPSTFSGNIELTIGDFRSSPRAFNYELTTVLRPYTGSTFGLEDGTLETAKFSNPTDMTQDSQGNFYVTDSGNHIIRKIDVNGNVSTYAGTPDDSNSSNTLVDGFRSNARFKYPTRIAIDNEDNIYISDSGNNAIRKITPEGNVVTIVKKFVNAIGVRDSLVRPNGIAVDHMGTLYVGDTGNNRILKVHPNGRVQLLAGSDRGFTDGIGFFSQFNSPTGIVMGSDGLYVADSGNNSIRKVSLDGSVTTLAGNGTEGNDNGSVLEATFSEPLDIALDDQGNLIILDTANNTIRLITENDEVVTWLNIEHGGTDDDGTAQLDDPSGLFKDASGTLFVIDRDNHMIKKIIHE